jgi:hypothetical protein
MPAVTYATCRASHAGGNMLTVEPPILAVTYAVCRASNDRLCGLVVRVLGHRSGGPGSITGTTRKKCSGSGTGSTQPREYKLSSYLIEK